jgi:hypothetical protein
MPQQTASFASRLLPGGYTDNRSTNTDRAAAHAEI